MKILHVIIGLHRGGAEGMLQRLILSHAGDSRWHHAVVSLTDVGPIGMELRARGVDVRALGMRSFLGAPIALARLRHHIQSLRPDIVQTWMYHADLLGGLAARSLGIQAVVWGVRTTDMMTGTSRATYAIRRLCAALSRWLPAVIVCAAESSRQAHVAVGYDPARLLVVPNGFPLDRDEDIRIPRSVVRASLRWTNDDVVVGWVGRFNAYKDPENFVRAAGLLVQRCPTARFVMVGKGIDAQNHELINWIDRQSPRPRFDLMGERPDVPALLGAMDLLCLSSRSEAFPNVVGEAMAAGVPCVVTDVGDAALMVADTGIVTAAEDPEALAAGLAAMVEMPVGARLRLGDRARQRVATEYSMDRARERFELVYTSVASGAPRST